MNGYSIDTSGTTGYSNKQAIMMSLKYNTMNSLYTNTPNQENIFKKENTGKKNMIRGLIALLISQKF